MTPAGRYLFLDSRSGHNKHDVRYLVQGEDVSENVVIGARDRWRQIATIKLIDIHVLIPHFAIYCTLPSFRACCSSSNHCSHSVISKRSLRTWPNPNLSTQRLCNPSVTNITKIIDLFLSTGTFPVPFKKSVVKPLLKKLLTNHCSIQISFLSKLSELVVLFRLNGYLTSNN